MKKVIILCSPTSDDFRKPLANGEQGYFFPPMGLLLVAQTLRNAGYEVRLYDGNFSLGYKKDILDYLFSNHEEILFVGFYLALLQIGDCIDIIQSTKSIDSNIPVVVGGPFPSAFPKMTMKSGMVDICSIGDGAETAKDIAQALATNKGLGGIPNITFMDNDKMVSNAMGRRDSLNGHNYIFYDNFIDLESYVNKFNLYLLREHNAGIKRSVPILTGLGCSYRCAFCQNALLGHNHISLPAEDIVEQIVYYHKKRDIDSFAFFDEDFFIDKPRLYKFIELIFKKNLKIKWGTQCRATHFNETYIDSKLLKDMERAGCVRLTIGIESGSPRMLKKINKAMSPEQAVQAAEYAKDSSIYFTYSFMINLPGEIREDVVMTFKLINKLLSTKKNSFITAIHPYMYLPGTPLSIEAEEAMGYKIEDNFTLEEIAGFSVIDYNRLLNRQKKDMVRECISYYYPRLNAPYEFRLSIRSIYRDVFRTIGIIRIKLKFFRLPLEIYLIEWMKAVHRAWGRLQTTVNSQPSKD